MTALAQAEHPVVQKTNPNTYFLADDAPPALRLDKSETFRQLFNRLKKYDDGAFGLKWYDEALLRRREKRALLDAIASQLDVPRSVKAAGKSWITRLDLRRYKRMGEPGAAPVLASFALCAYLCHRRGWPTHPNCPQLHDRFAYIKDDLGITDEEFTTFFGRVEHDVRTQSWKQN